MSLGRNTNEGKKLKYIVDEVEKREEEIASLKVEIKDLKNAAPEQCGISAKTITKMVKERAFSDADRKAQMQLEDETDRARHALGMQLDMDLRGGKDVDPFDAGNKKPAKEAKKSQAKKARDKYNRPVKQPDGDDDKPTLQM